ncbi:hypothetical protein SteCoe_20278 [Stentor coeruleus]|uniref:Uncharacterized protein n=1 Tax=Stentor coeruleus TaxID=5963 RepID=A0A1R2BS75_9CILI|nr:hypothetical protein SteCoe_20278 [Stentor coeruleus]
MNKSVVSIQESLPTESHHQSVLRASQVGENRSSYATYVKSTTNNSISSAASGTVITKTLRLPPKKPMQSKNEFGLPKSNSVKNIQHPKEYKQKLQEVLSKENNLRMKKYESSGILPHVANVLRRDSILAVEMNRKMLQFKKETYFLKCFSQRNLVVTEASAFEMAQSKTDIRNKVLEDLRMTITNQHIKPVVITARREEQPEKNIDEFIQYVNWLSGEGKKQYEVQPFSYKKLKFKSYN